MSTRTPSLEDIRLAGIEALARELGPIGMVRFLQQFETGRGDYTIERDERLNQLGGLNALIEQIRQKRSKVIQDETE